MTDPVISVDLPDGTGAVHHLGRHRRVSAHYGLAVVGVDTWEQVNTTADRMLLAKWGPRIPGAGHVRAGHALSADILPAGYDGIPPGHDGSRVRWFAPPHPLAFTDAECAATIDGAPPVRDGNYATMVHLPYGTAPTAYDRIAAAVAVTNAQGWCLDVRLEAVTILRYREGEGINWHDDTVARSIADGADQGGHLISAVVQLSDPGDYKAGSVQFATPDGTLTLPRTRGTVAVFPSSTRHRVTRLASGERWSLTTFMRSPGAGT